MYHVALGGEYIAGGMEEEAWEEVDMPFLETWHILLISHVTVSM